jgi:hypothetical protein
MTGDEWLREVLEHDREKVAIMKRDLAAFESGQMHLLHNGVDVSEGHMAFLRKAISETEAMLAKIGGRDA